MNRLLAVPDCRHELISLSDPSRTVPISPQVCSPVDIDIAWCQLEADVQTKLDWTDISLFREQPEWDLQLVTHGGYHIATYFSFCPPVTTFGRWNSSSTIFLCGCRMSFDQMPEAAKEADMGSNKKVSHNKQCPLGTSNFHHAHQLLRYHGTLFLVLFL